MPSVAVAVLTYRRNESIARIVPLLVDQVRRSAPDGRVIVIDNDPNAGARAVLAGMDQLVRYVHEPIPGIAAGRNRALDEAAAEDLIVFIDDDERPEAGWLAALLRAHESTGADAVVGWVKSEFAAPLDPWLEAGGFFHRQRHATGTAVPAAATNNLLLDLATIRRLGLRFDPDFGLSGGSDTMFTRQLVLRGGSLVWCDEAVVYDLVPPDRAVRKWALRRWFRSGNTWGRTSVRIAAPGADRLRARADTAATGGARLIGGLGQFVAGRLLGRVRTSAQGARRAARGLGMLSAALGYTYVEYHRRPTGRRTDRSRAVLRRPGG